MHLRIVALWGTVYEWEIQKATIPTYDGEITILPGHQPLSSVVKAGLLSFVPAGDVSATGEGVTLVDGNFYISVSKGLILIDGKQITVTTSAATTSPDESVEVLQTMQAEMEAQLEKIKVDGNASDLELAVDNMEKIQADIKLARLRG